ncbi:MAG: DUF2231 domain-containing protein [Rhodocyclaceae bacterium]|nr:DUF2231 domain-containing protein [Rhodocyclaceae bacterium]
MQTPASIAKHPIHPMLVAFPIGLWIFSLICDFVAMARAGSDAAAGWETLALYTMVGGIIGALAAAVPGLIDLLSLTDPDVKKIAVTHMSINLTVVALYLINTWLRLGGMESRLPIGLSVLTVLMLGVSGWLGGEMVHVHGVGVQPPEGDRRHADAHDNAFVQAHAERRMTKHFG